MPAGDDSEDTDDLVFECLCDDETPMSIAVVRAVCAIEGVDPAGAPEELGFALYDHVDPEALDAILSGNATDGPVRIAFTVDGYRIAITETGRITVQPRS